MKRILSIAAVSFFFVTAGLTQSIRTSDSLWFSTNNSSGEPKLTSISLGKGVSVDLYVWLKIAAGSGFDAGGIFLPLYYSQPAETLLRAGANGSGGWSGNTGGPPGVPTDTSFAVYPPFSTWAYRAAYDSTYSGLSDSAEILLAFAQSVSAGSGWNGRTAVAKIRFKGINSGSAVLSTMRHILSTGARNPVELSNTSGSLSWAPVVVPLSINVALSSVLVQSTSSWNMLSIPVTVSDYHKTVLFPTAISSAFTYQGSYFVQTILANTIGFWLKFDTAQTLTFTGVARTSDTVNVAKGWNMIGSISSSVAVASITSIPGGIVSSPFFGYSGSYFVSTRIDSGKAYWVKVSADGKLTLSASSQEPALSERIRIVATGEMPPPPPDGKPSSVRPGIPGEYGLEQNHPNPFNPSTVIRYNLPEDAYVTLRIYEVIGREVAVLVEGMESAGYKSVSFDAGNLPSGVYFYRLQAGNFVDVKKMLLMK